MSEAEQAFRDGKAVMQIYAQRAIRDRARMWANTENTFIGQEVKEIIADELGVVVSLIGELD